MADLVAFITTRSNSDAACAQQVRQYTGEINDTDSTGTTPLRAAIIMSRDQTVVALGARGDVDANKTGNIGYFPPLMFAASYVGNVGMVPLLLAAFPAADVDQRDVDGYTALHAAARHGNEDDVVVLLAAGADTSLVFNGETAKVAAARCRHFSVSALIADAAAWQAGVRQAWLRACVLGALGDARSRVAAFAPSQPLAAVLGDTARISIPQADNERRFHLLSEYGLLVALFL